MNELDEYIYETKIVHYDFINCLAQTSSGFLYKCKISAKIVILRVVTVLEKEELDEVISEINQRCKKQSKWFGKVEDCFIYQSNLYIVEEYFENGSLMDLVLKRKKLEDYECASIFFHLTRFIDLMHSSGMIINDIKPSHIFVTEEGSIKMFSFTMSQLFQQKVKRSKTVVKAAPYYVAPEIIKGGVPTASSDVWSLGMTLYMLAVKDLPFRTSEPFKILFEIVNGPAPTLPPDLSNGLRSFIHGCLQKDPEKRLSTKQLLGHEFVKESPPQNMVAEIFFRPENETNSVVSSEPGASRKDAVVDDCPQEVVCKPEVKRGPSGSSGIVKRKGALSIATEAILSLANPSNNKGSIVGDVHQLLKGELEQQREPSEWELAAGCRMKEHEALSSAALKIKRVASKVDKVRPGLSNLVGE